MCWCVPPIWQCFGVSPSDWLCVCGVWGRFEAALDPKWDTKAFWILAMYASDVFETSWLGNSHSGINTIGTDKELFIFIEDKFQANNSTLCFRLALRLFLITCANSRNHILGTGYLAFVSGHISWQCGILARPNAKGATANSLALRLHFNWSQRTETNTLLPFIFHSAAFVVCCSVITMCRYFILKTFNWFHSFRYSPEEKLIISHIHKDLQVTHSGKRTPLAS